MDNDEYEDLVWLLAEPLEKWVEKNEIDQKLNIASDQAAYMMSCGLLSFMLRCSTDHNEVKNRFLKLKK